MYNSPSLCSANSFVCFAVTCKNMMYKMKANTKDAILDIVNNRIVDKPIREDEHLFSSRNRLSYHDMVYLRILIEKEFEIQLSLQDYKDERFFTIDGLCMAIEKKLSEKKVGL